MENTSSELARIQAAFSSRKWQWCFTNRAELPVDLITALRLGLAHIDVGTWQQRLAWGGTYINGRSVNSNCELPLPCKIEYYEPNFPLEKAEQFYPQFSSDQIIYRDESLLVAFKPAGIPSMPAREQPHYNFKSQIEEFTRTTVHMPARLDMSACGLLIASTDKRYHAAVNRLYETRSIRKYYQLEVSGCVSWRQCEVDAAIAKDSLHAVLRKVVLQGGKSAVTQFSLLEQRSATSLLEARPQTGRTHQIRVHAKHLGHALVGDRFYGGVEAAQLHLACVRLAFTHPASNLELDLRLPRDFMPSWANY